MFFAYAFNVKPMQGMRNYKFDKCMNWVEIWKGYFDAYWTFKKLDFNFYL